MRAEQPLSTCAGPDPETGLRLTFPGTAADVRTALADLLGHPPLSGLAEGARGMAELVLAEVLNNIAEHAYAAWPGLIRVRIARQGPDVICGIEDEGMALPDGVLPQGRLAPVAAGDLPEEGGYGWYLIRSLTSDLAYERCGERNRLSFRLCTKQSA